MKTALRVSGRTYPKKDKLKKLGCRWLAPLKEWVWFGEEKEMFKMAKKIREMGLELWLNVEDSTGKLATFVSQGVVYASCSNQPTGSPEWELGRQLNEEF